MTTQDEHATPPLKVWLIALVVFAACVGGLGALMLSYDNPLEIFSGLM